MWFLVSAVSGIILDIIFGDPDRIPHPVVLIGKLISAMEKFLRRVFPETPEGMKKAGLITAAFVPAVSFIVPAILLYAAYRINFWLWFALNTFWSFQIPASRCLAKESRKVYDRLEKNDLQGARKQLSFLVGRETSELSETEVINAAVETVAENTSDGVTAPVFFMFIGGAPLGFFYKAVNTLDSMIGYRNEKYEYFGKYSAKLDDIMNFIPSRICGLLMVVSSFICGENYREAWRIFIRDRKNHLSPNSAQTESAAAGALGIQLGGPHVYFGKVVDKPFIGDKVRDSQPDDILRMNRIMFVTSFLSFIIPFSIWLAILSIM